MIFPITKLGMGDQGLGDQGCWLKAGMSNGLSMNTYSLKKVNSLRFQLLVIQDEGWPLDLTELHSSVVPGRAGQRREAGIDKTDGSLTLKCKLGILPIRLWKALFCIQV